MSEFNREGLNKKSKPKVNKSLIKKSKVFLGMQTVGFKGAIKVLDLDIVDLIEESFEGQTKFLEDRIKANVPKGSLSTPLKKSIKVEVKRNRNKVTLVASSDKSYAVKVHEQPPVEGLPFKPTLEGGEGSKFISRVFEKHKDKIRDDTLDTLAKGIGDHVKKNK